MRDARVGREDPVHQLAQRTGALAVDDPQVGEVRLDRRVERLGQLGLGFVDAQTEQLDFGGNIGGRAVGP